MEPPHWKIALNGPARQFELENERKGRAGAAAFVLICGGMIMCFMGLTTKGSIDLKAAVIEGHIETGSLTLLAMFLGVLIILVLILAKHRPYDGQEIKLVVNGYEIIGKGLSYRKMRELVQVMATATEPAGLKPRTGGQL